MEQPVTSLLLNPVRMRIVQYLLVHQPATAQEIGGHLSDVPRASLYRHLKLLTQGGLVNVVSESRIRGAVERTYALNQQPVPPPGGEEGGLSENERLRSVLESTLLCLLSEFEHYLVKETADPVRDKLLLQTSTLLLSDEEFDQFLREISLAYSRILDNKPNEDRRMRRVTLISSPAEPNHRQS